MKEDFLHYVWQYKKFDFSNLVTVSGELLTIAYCGHYLKQSGPDFFNAQIILDDQKWAGNIEMHVKSSDWYLHQHEKDFNYDNVILHVVWEHDMPVFRKDNTEIPVLELKHYVSEESLRSYQSLMIPKTWIYCESQLRSVDAFVMQHWKERLFVERLERKSVSIQRLLEQMQYDWEAVLFCLMAKNFGLNTNGDLFLKMAESIPFSVLRKERFEVENLEALFLGQLHLLVAEAEDVYARDLNRRYAYLCQKHQLQAVPYETAQFFRHRPDNFPTIRLAQLAMLYHRQDHLFANITAAKTREEFYDLFDVSVSEYWQNHYQFDQVSLKKQKCLSKSFIDLLICNTIVPLQFAYAKSLGKEVAEATFALMQTIAPEKNSIIEKFATFGVKAKNAFETQSLLQLKNEYCHQRQCLQCAIGIQLLKS
ncbi:DUF2851 family protein [Flavobacterium silvisoli]|uniref:DUF2851 family protein n=1 Tax=Flavobacterium silvisoli TaxID=2529433 RepID=A0A4Q9YVD2_9FLAO|nr:DUF2851 family protein [Flavobacterium silvisoli]TBX65969.1 DUF2851 family protein [Flavobacterium silvisoli]